MNKNPVAVLMPAIVVGTLGLIAGLASFAAHGAPGTNVSVSIALTGGPGARKVELSWPSRPGAIYKLQHRASLGAGDPWRTFDVFQPTGAMFRVTLDGDPLKEESHFREATGFFQLILPEPEIFSIEPARFPFGGTTELYVIGQCFDSNTALRVQPPTQHPSWQIIHPGLLRVFFTPQTPGTYTFTLFASDGTDRSSFAVECFDPAAPPSSVLQEPPDEPWASPVSNDPATKGIVPVPIKVKEKGNRTVCKSNLRVTPSGELEAEAVDLFIPGVGLDFVWARRYRSRSGPNTEQGNRWDFSHNVRATQVAGGMEVRDGAGRADVFPQAADGTFGRDEHFYIGTLTGLVFRLTFADTGYWEFLPLDGSTSAGRLARIVDRNANTMRLEYDGLGRLARVIDTLDRTNTIAYSPANGKISSVTDFSGRSVTYAYYRAGEAGGNDGDLKSVTSPPVTGTPNGNDFPAGKTETYTYTRGFVDPRQNSLLRTVTDAKGQVKHEHVYQHNQTDLEFLRLRASRIGYSNQIVTYRYLAQTPSPSNGFATQKIIVNDRAGNVSEHLYDARHRLLNLREFTGRAMPGLHVSETTNRPTGKLRMDDPDFFETRFEWNNDSLCTRVVHPRGNSTEMVYQRAFNQNSSRSNHTRRHEGNLRVLRERACCGGADTDGDGLPDTAELVTRFEYDPRFGSPPACSFYTTTPGHKYVDTLTLRRAARGPGVKYGQCWVFSGTTHAIRIIDPRGTVTTATYDARGNLLHTERKAEFHACDYTFDERGRITSMTHPADGDGQRRVDVFSYYDSGPQAGYFRDGVVNHGANRLNLTTTYEYDARGNVTRCIDPRGFDTRWIYNALDQCVEAQTPPNTSYPYIQWKVSLSYDANDNLVRVDTDNRDHTGALDSANPHWSSFAEYDLLDRQTLLGHEVSHIPQQGGGTNATSRFHYDANDNLVLVESPEAVNGNDPNNIAVYRYDERDLPFECVAAPGTGLGATSRFDYDANANCRKVNKIDAFTIKQKTIEHDGFDRPVRVTDAMGNVLTRAFDRNGNLVFERLDGELEDQPGSAQNRRLSETRYEYDSLDRLTRFRPAFFDVFTDLAIGDGEATTSFSYAPNGLLLSETDDNGHQTRYRYDSANRLSAVSRGLIEAGPFEEGVQVCSFAYDANDNVLTMTQTDRSGLGGAPQVFTTTYEYDGLNRRVRATDNLGNSENWSFDSRDNIVRSVDANGNLTGYSYDGLSRRTLAIADLDGDGALDRFFDVFTEWGYDDNSRLTSITDDNTNTTLYAYDALDRRGRATSADGTAHVFVWDAFDNLGSEQDANGTIVTYTYDLLDRCTRKDIVPAPGVATTTTLETFNYDGESRLVRAATLPTSAGGTEYILEWAWNSLSDLGEQSSGGLALRATHDGVGNRLQLDYPGGRQVFYSYDVLNRVTSVDTSPVPGARPANLAVLDYDGPGRLAKIARANGVNTRINWGGYPGAMQLQGDFGWQQVTRVNHQVSQGGAFLDTRVFAYDRAQNKILRAQTVAFSAGRPTQTNRFAYDKLHRLTRGTKTRGAVVEQDTQYQLDGNGNRQQVIANGTVMPYLMDNTLPEPADFQMNQYSLTPFGPRSYDRNGNQVSIDSPAGATEFTYDYADRLVSVRRTVGPALVPVADYAYDALGRRVSKTVHLDPPMAPVTTVFFHDGETVIEARGSIGNSLEFFDLKEKNGVLTAFVNGIGDVLYYHADDLGNVLALTDAAGNVLERYDYDDYGAPRFLDAKGDPLTDATGQPVTSSPAGNPFLFHGMEWDAETGLYHDGAREGVNPLYEEKGLSGHNPMHASKRLYVGNLSWSTSDTHYDPDLGRYITRNSGHSGNWDFSGGSSVRSFAGNNPWSSGRSGGIRDLKRDVIPNTWCLSGGGGGGVGGLAGGILRTAYFGGDRPSAGGGGGGGGAVEVMFNPKEYTITKSVPWNSSASATHGKWKTFRGGGIRLHETAGRLAGDHVEGPWHGGGWIPDAPCEDSGLCVGNRSCQGVAILRRRVEVLKSNKQGDPNANRLLPAAYLPRHDTAMNSIRNIK